MSVLFSIHPGDALSVSEGVTDVDCFYVDTPHGILMLYGDRIHWFRDQLNARYPVTEPLPETPTDEFAPETAEPIDETDLREVETEADNWYDQNHKSGE